jgi:hypothetical protein
VQSEDFCSVAPAQLADKAALASHWKAPPQVETLLNGLFWGAASAEASASTSASSSPHDEVTQANCEHGNHSHSNASFESVDKPVTTAFGHVGKLSEKAADDAEAEDAETGT